MKEKEVVNKLIEKKETIASLEPSTHVMVLAKYPPVHDSIEAIVSFFSINLFTTSFSFIYTSFV